MGWGGEQTFLADLGKRPNALKWKVKPLGTAVSQRAMEVGVGMAYVEVSTSTPGTA